ncbi:PHD finger-like protein [Parasponia andersonii]|uniref:PHD finger-like protein n=1 Tax=Parasponia andersonii TaxID=3476 RepID=A0A2P5BMJ7_PARAD|nr:PHD finger-like protein [Parasponia andersonii]
MDTNLCDVNHLDADVLLPPRKRLLAGLKKQSSDCDASLQLSLVASSSSSPASASASASLPSPSSPSSSEFNIRLGNLLSSHNANLSPEETVQASKSAAAAALKAAEAARVAAEEKAAIAAKAVAAAKSALDLVASFSEEAVSKEKYLKKNKFKKHVPVQLLYKKYQPIENCKKDEELARKLHRAINSSPRISKNSSGSEHKGHKHKKPKVLSSSDKTRDSNGVVVLEQNYASTCNGHATAGEVDTDAPVRELCKSKADEMACTYDKAGQSEIDNREAELDQPKGKIWDDMSASGKKRGRVKLKKLPLSMCTFRDQANPKEEVDIRKSPLTDMNMGNPKAGNMPLFTVEPSAEGVMPIEAKSVWKCQEFKATECVKQNKVVQS